jgi:hypothetical protein
MCDKCQQLDTRIHRHRKFVAQGLDALTVERINELIQELQQRKEAMHQGQLRQVDRRDCSDFHGMRKRTGSGRTGAAGGPFGLSRNTVLAPLRVGGPFWRD